ncbi:MAG: RecX family transcriptional regulator [Bacteroidia bacterium]|nr:RecX family transcriptional regulator [Bacteroidia bacterium]
MVEHEKQKIYDSYSILMKMQNWCAYQERSQFDVRGKLNEFQLNTEDKENIIVKLIEENYINEERFAIQFARGKFSIKKWGRIKIRQELKQKKVSDYCIKKALEQIEDKIYLETLEYILNKKNTTIKETNHLKRRFKLINYATSKGYELDLIQDVLKNMLDK